MLVAVFFICGIFPADGSQLAQLAAAYPQHPEVLNSYGIELANNGDLMGAITVWRRALDFDRGNVHLYNNIGSALKRLGQDEHAYAWYAAALQIKPVYWTYYNLAIIYRDRGQLRDAGWALEQALALQPDFAEARTMLSRLQPEINSEKHIMPSPVIVQSIEPEKPAVAKAPVTAPAKPAASVIKTVKTPPAVAARPQLPVPAGTSAPLQVPADSGGQVFLTFDGGATDAGFDSIVDSLRSYGVKCTFFLTGKFAEKYPEKTRRLIQEGHEVANHSMNHPNMKSYSAEKIAAEIEAAEKSFEKVLGKRGAPFFRFPFGAQNKQVEKIVEDLGYKPVYWHIDTIDWREDPVATIIGRVNSKLRRNSVILMHLGSKNGAKALDEILRIITSRGYTLARLSDLDVSQLAILP